MTKRRRAEGDNDSRIEICDCLMACNTAVNPCVVSVNYRRLHLDQRLGCFWLLRWQYWALQNLQLVRRVIHQQRIILTADHTATGTHNEKKKKKRLKNIFSGLLKIKNEKKLRVVGALLHTCASFPAPGWWWCCASHVPKGCR